MKWNWQQENWPNFGWDKGTLDDLEAQFLHQAGVLLGALKHVSDDEKTTLIVELISTEALKTSEIEGEILNRNSVQSSIRKNFGLDEANLYIPPAEQGIAEMMGDLYRSFNEPLSHDRLFRWHEMLMKERHDLSDVGLYRTHEDAMQIVSGAAYDPTIHFEAPPSRHVHDGMRQFIDWFTESAPGGRAPLPALTRSGIAHLYFVCVHPFEDGNGRIGRAVSEKVLSQSLGQPALLAVSQTIQNGRKVYCQNLEQSNKRQEITPWLQYFAHTILETQRYSLQLIDFLIAKTRLYDRLRGQLNERQERSIIRMFREGLEGFKGGLSAENYISITGASRATTTRDLHDLVEKNALARTGKRRYKRYWLNMGTGKLDYETSAS